MSKHTPGPWEVVGHGGLEVRSTPEQILIAGCFYTGTNRRGQSKANARLISAAPKMLEALELAQATIVRLDRGDHESAKETLNVIYAAIAHAEARE